MMLNELAKTLAGIGPNPANERFNHYDPHLIPVEVVHRKAYILIRLRELLAAERKRLAGKLPDVADRILAESGEDFGAP